MTQILTQNGKNQCGQRSTNGKEPLQLSYQRAPKGRFSTEKTPFPTLLSSRSGVRVPPGVPFQQLNMVGVVQLAEHRIVVPGVVGSSPITHPIKISLRKSGGIFFIYGRNGTRKAVKKTVRWTVFRPWESTLLCRCIRYGCRCKANLICHRKCKRAPYPNPIILHGHKNAFDPGLTQTGKFTEKHRVDDCPPGFVLL